MGFRVLEVIRHSRRILPVSTTTLDEGDLLLVQGVAANLMKVRAIAGIDIMPELKHGDLEVPADDVRVAELLISPQSEVDGLNLAEANFRQRYDLVVLAIYRAGQPLRDKLRSIRLRMGDLLLVQGRSERIAALRRGSGFFVLGEMAPRVYPRRKGLYVVSLFAVALVVGASGVLPVPIALLGAAVGAVLLRCLSMEEAYNAIDWRLLVLIGGMTAFGAAMQNTGAAAYLAGILVSTLGPLGDLAVLAGFAVLTVLLTQPMSNAAAALVVLPVAMSAAHGMGLNPRTFAIAIMLSASVSFIAPLEPSCILVYNPGRYRFMDFVKVGSLLTLVLLVVVLTMLPLLWPLHPTAAPAP
jgi:di/tricarboxylate transporter